MRRRMTGEALGFGAVMLVGLALLACAAWAIYAEVSFRAGASMTEARIVEMRPSTSRGSDGRDSTVYYPVFDFALPDGQAVRAVGPIGSGTPCCEVGDIVTIRYDPARPQRAAQDSFEDSWLLPTVLGGFGSLVFGMGLLFFHVFGGTRTAAVADYAPPRFQESGLARIAGLRRIETPDGPRWVVVARLTDPLTKQERDFEGAPIDFDPKARFALLPMLRVQYDRGPGGAYLVDLDILHNEARREQGRQRTDASPRHDVMRVNGIAMDGSEPVGRALPLSLLGIGGVLLLAAAAFAWPQVAFLRGAISVPGRVVDMRWSSGGASPVFVFTPLGGSELRVTSRVVSNPPCCEVGEAVSVRYRPEAPRQARIASFRDAWLVPLAIGGFGLFWFVPGLIVLWIHMTGGSARRTAGGVTAPRRTARASGMAARPGKAARGVVPAAPRPDAAGLSVIDVPLAGLRRAETPAGPRWFVQARWHDTASGAERILESDPLPFDPVPQMRDRTTVPVLLDPGVPDGPHAMDLSFLRAPA